MRALRAGRGRAGSQRAPPQHLPCVRPPGRGEPRRPSARTCSRRSRGQTTVAKSRAAASGAWPRCRPGSAAPEGATRGSRVLALRAARSPAPAATRLALASELTRARLPWLVGPVAWTPAIARRAVVWLSLHLQKPILKLVDEEYGENGMADLLTEQGPAYEVNIRIFNQVQHTITGWPGGKPTADDSHRPERATPFPKRVLVLSPEPCDDTLGMGGTLRRLVRQGHAVTVAYLTSGNLAVPDEDAEMAADLMLELAQDDKGLGAGKADFAWGVREQLLSRGAFAVDSDEVRRLKGLLRRGEARSVCRSLFESFCPARSLELHLIAHPRPRGSSRCTRRCPGVRNRTA